MARRNEPEDIQGSASVSIRLPKEMLDQIDRMAEEERRSRGNMIRYLLEDALQARKQEK